MRSTLLLRLAAVTLALVPSACVLFGQDDDGRRRLGAKTVIAEFRLQEQAMLLVAYRSDAGLCVETQNADPPHNPGGGCGFGVPEDESISVVTEGSEQGVVLHGPVAKDVADVSVQLANGGEVDAGPFGGGAGFNVNFFVAALPPDVHAESVTAKDGAGNVIELDKFQNPFVEPVGENGSQ